MGSKKAAADRPCCLRPFYKSKSSPVFRNVDKEKYNKTTLTIETTKKEKKKRDDKTTKHALSTLFFSFLSRLKKKTTKLSRRRPPLVSPPSLRRPGVHLRRGLGLRPGGLRRRLGKREDRAAIHFRLRQPEDCRRWEQ